MSDNLHLDEFLKNDKELVALIQNHAFKNSDIELKNAIDKFEKENFDSSEEHADAKKLVDEIHAGLRLCEISINNRSVIWKIFQICTLYDFKGGEVTVSDAMDIKTRSEELFGE